MVADSEFGIHFFRLSRNFAVLPDLGFFKLQFQNIPQFQRIFKNGNKISTHCCHVTWMSAYLYDSLINLFLYYHGSKITYKNENFYSGVRDRLSKSKSPKISKIFFLKVGFFQNSFPISIFFYKLLEILSFFRVKKKSLKNSKCRKIFELLQC